MCLLLSVFDVMAGVRTVPYFNKLDGVSKRGRESIRKDTRVDKCNVRSVFSPVLRFHSGRAQG